MPGRTSDPPTAGEWQRWAWKAIELVRLIHEAGEPVDSVLVDLSEKYRRKRAQAGRHGTTSTTLRRSVLPIDDPEPTPVRKDPRREPED